jgi:hypothetical protein
LLWYKQNNNRYLIPYIFDNPGYTPYPPSREPSEGYPYLTYKNEYRPYDYWSNIDNAFMSGYNDKHALYINASSDNTSAAGDRFAEGQASAMDLMKQLDNGNIFLAEGETIKLVSHSQGGAFAAGMASVLSKSKKYASILQEVVYLEPHQPGDFRHPSSIKGLQISSRGDRVASKWNIIESLKGRTRFSWIDGVDKRIENDTHKGDYLGGHSIGTNLDEIANYFSGLGVKITIR